MAARKTAAASAAAAVSANFYAIVGSDESEVKRAAKEAAERLSPPGGDDFSREIIDGAVAYVDEATERIHQTIDALLTFPFFGGEKFVWLKNANFLGDTVMGRSANVQEALEKLLATLNGGVPPATRFLLSATEIDKRRTFYKSLQKVAKVEVFDKLDPSKSGWEEEAAAMTRQFANEAGLRFDEDAMDLFVLFTGGDRRAIANELEKLDLYLGPEARTIDAESVRTLVPMSRAGVVWELGNAISARDLRRALDLLDTLLFQGETPIGIILVAIIPTVRNLLLAKDLMQRHRLSKPQQPFFFGKTLEKLPEEATAHLPRKKEGGINAFALGAAAIHAHRFETAELRAGLEACLQANAQLVTSGGDPEVVLSQLIVRIVGGEQPRQNRAR